MYNTIAVIFTVIRFTVLLYVLNWFLKQSLEDLKENFGKVLVYSLYILTFIL